MRLSSFVETKSLNQFLRERATNAFTQDRNLREQIDAWLEVWFVLPVLINSFVAGAHPDNAVSCVVQHFRSGKFRKDIDTCLLAFFAQPGRQPVKRHNVIAMIHEWRGHDGRPNGMLPSEELIKTRTAR